MISHSHFKQFKVSKKSACVNLPLQKHGVQCQYERSNFGKRRYRRLFQEFCQKTFESKMIGLDFVSFILGLKTLQPAIENIPLGE